MLCLMTASGHGIPKPKGSIQGEYNSMPTVCLAPVTQFCKCLPFAPKQEARARGSPRQRKPYSHRATGEKTGSTGSPFACIEKTQAAVFVPTKP